MNLLIEYMSFDVSWFTTTPGLLVTAGLILVIVGAVVALLSGKKKENNVDEKNEEVTPVDPTVDANPVETPVVEKTEESVSVPTVEAALEVVPAEPVVLETPVESAPVVEEEKVENVTVEVPSQPVVEEQPEVVLEPAVESLPVEEVSATPVEEVKEEVKVDVPVVEEKVEAQPAVSIYGGASPQVAVAVPEEPRKAYGGADPLENTGALPRVEVPSEPVVVPVASQEEVLEIEEVSATPVEEVKEEATPVTPVIEELVVEAPVEEVKEVKPVASATPKDDVETLEF